MKVYDIKDGYNYSQTHSVVAENMAEAERIYLEKYKNVTIKEIKLHAEYVQVQALNGQEDSDNG